MPVIFAGSGIWENYGKAVGLIESNFQKLKFYNIEWYLNKNWEDF